MSQKVIKRSEILSDELLIKILQYLSLENKSRIAFVSKQLSRSVDQIISKKTSIAIYVLFSDRQLLVSLSIDHLIIRISDEKRRFIHLNHIKTRYESTL